VADESGPKQANPLIRQVDTLLRGHDAEGEVPVLTDVVDGAEGREAMLDPAVLEALARQLERAVLDHLGPEFNRVIEERLARALSVRLEQAVAELRADLVAGLDQMAREAVASAIANTFSSKGAGGRTPPAPGRSPTKPT
jgi:uncharacterized NAD(P)/FAD-binding protein YdhS